MQGCGGSLWVDVEGASLPLLLVVDAQRERSGVNQCYWVWREAEHTFTAGMLHLRLVRCPYVCHQISESLYVGQQRR